MLTELKEIKKLIVDEKERAIEDSLKNRYKAYVYDTHHNIATVEILSPQPTHFEPGDPVGMIYGQRDVRYVGTVIDSSGEILTLQLFATIKEGYVKLVDYELPMIYDLQLALISKLLEEEPEMGEEPKIDINIINEKAFDIVFSDLELGSLRYSPLKNPRLSDGTVLDDSQRRAVEAALALEDNEVLLITGPPGTGKTRVIAKIAEELANRGEKVLVTSHTNRAVDNALELLPVEKTLRVGRPEKVLDSVKPRLLGRKVREKLGEDFRKNEEKIKKLISKIRDIRNLIRDLRGLQRSTKILNTIEKEMIEKREKHLEMLKRDLENSLKKRHEMIQKAANEVIRDTPIIGSTLVKSQLGIMSDKSFNTVIIDEASQASITLALLAMVKGKKWVVVGDDRQLLPIFRTIDIKESEDLGIFTRLLRKYGDRRNLWLEIHYRSNPEIIGFPAQYAYNGKIRPHESCKNKILVLGDKPKYDVLDPERPFVFVHVDGSSSREGESKYNEDEAEVTAEIVRDLIRCGVSRDKIGVITPYRAQRAKISEKLKDIDTEIGTVDQFQGREKDVIIFSVTSTDSMDFASYPNRLNVAITRASRKLIVVGNGRAIYRHKDFFEKKDWKFKDCNLYSLLKYCYKNKAIYSWKEKKWAV